MWQRLPDTGFSECLKGVREVPGPKAGVATPSTHTVADCLVAGAVPRRLRNEHLLHNPSMLPAQACGQVTKKGVCSSDSPAPHPRQL